MLGPHQLHSQNSTLLWTCEVAGKERRKQNLQGHQVLSGDFAPCLERLSEAKDWFSSPFHTPTHTMAGFQLRRNYALLEFWSYQCISHQWVKKSCVSSVQRAHLKGNLKITPDQQQSPSMRVWLKPLSRQQNRTQAGWKQQCNIIEQVNKSPKKHRHIDG